MKTYSKLLLSIAAGASLVTAAPAFADGWGHERYEHERYEHEGYEHDRDWDRWHRHAEVVYSAPAYYGPPAVAYSEPQVVYSQPQPAAVVGGAIAGAVIGSQLGRGDGRVFSTAIGAAVGGIIGAGM